MEGSNAYPKIEGADHVGANVYAASSLLNIFEQMGKEGLTVRQILKAGDMIQTFYIVVDVPADAASSQTDCSSST